MILEKIQKDLKEALLAKEAVGVSTLRFLVAAIHNRRIEKQSELVDEDVVAVIRQQVKQHRESIEAYQRGNRDDLVRKEQAELAILNTYLPQQIPQNELEKIVKEAITQSGAAGPADFGRVMSMVMAKAKGRVEGAQVAEIVKNRLSLL